MKFSGRENTLPLLLVCLLFPLFSQAANIQSAGTGLWNDPATWVGAIPGANDNVTIMPGHTVTIPDNNTPITIKRLIVDAGGFLELGKADFTVNLESDVLGNLTDLKREGINRFIGPVTFGNNSRADFRESHGTGGNVQFENGLTNNGDTLFFRKVQFLANDQAISGASLVVVTELLEIDDTYTLTNANSGGILFDEANFLGMGAGAVFRNEALLRIRYRWTPMLTGSVDFSPAGNEVRYEHRGDQEIREGTYARLIVEEDPNSLFRNRYLTGAIVVNEYLRIDDNSRMEPQAFNMTVNGNTEIFGRLTDPNGSGVNQFQDVTLNGLINGNFNGYGNIIVYGDLDITGTPTELNEANLSVLGTTTIAPGATLLINRNQGPRIFRELVISPGATFDSRADDGVVLAGTVTNNGSFLWKFGTLSGKINHVGDTAWINKFEVEGMNAEISGTKNIWIKDQILIDSASVLTNTNTSSVYLYDRSKLIGLHPTAVFRNKGVLHNQTDNSHMEVGTIDGNYPGSVFHYDRQNNLGQKLSPGTYYDVIVLGGEQNGIRKVTFPSLDTMEVGNLFHIGEYVKFEPQTSTIISHGNAIIRNSEIFDGDAEGSITFDTVDVSGGKFAGGGNTNGNFIIREKFKIESGDFEMQNGSIIVEGQTLISPGRTLAVTTKTGYRDFGRVEIESGAAFIDNTNGGFLHFSGQVVNRGVFQVDNPVIMSGVEVYNDSTYLLRPIFRGNAVLVGSNPLILNDVVLVDSNSVAINRLDSLVFQTNASFDGVDASSVFVNEANIYWEKQDLFMTTGTLDCSQMPNKVIYQIKKGDVTLRPGTYWDLVLQTPEEGNLPKRRLVDQPLTCLGNLTLEWNVELQPEKADINVGQTAYIYGKIYDDEADGVMIAENMLLGNALIDGQSSARFGSFIVENELSVPFGESFWEKADLEVRGLMSVTDSAILNLNTNVGSRFFHDIYVGNDGYLNENGNGQLVTVDGEVQVEQGTFSLSFGDYLFAGPVLVGEEGIMTSNRSGSSYQLLDTISVSGTGELKLPNSDIILKGPLTGDGNLIVEGDLLISSGDTLVNEMTGDEAFMMRGTLNGENQKAHFVNIGTFRYGPASNAPLMELGGQYDFVSHENNLVIFDGNSGFQPVPADSFLNIGFENGSPKVISGDSLKVLGDLFFSVEIRKDPNIFSSGILLLLGENDQTISGAGVGSVQNLVVSKTGGTATVLEDFGINEGLVMQRGILNASPGVIGISGNGFLQEGDYSYVIGRVGSERNINQGENREFGGMGIKIKPEGANMGPTTVFRITGQALVPGQVDRYYEIYPTNNSDLDATIEFGYHERELNGAVETDLQVTHRAEPGGSFEVLGGGTYRISNFVRKTGIERLGVVSLVPSTMAVNAYPSPFTGSEFTVSFTLAEEDLFVDLRIFDMAGREWAHQTVEASAGINKIDFEDLELPGGTYIVRIVSRGESGFHYVQKLNE